MIIQYHGIVKPCHTNKQKTIVKCTRAAFPKSIVRQSRLYWQFLQYTYAYDPFRKHSPVCLLKCKAFKKKLKAWSQFIYLKSFGHDLFWRYSTVYFRYLTVQKWRIYEQGVLFLQGIYLSIRVGFNVYLWALSYSGPLRGKLWLSTGKRVMAPETAAVFFGSGSFLLLLSRLTASVWRFKSA